MNNRARASLLWLCCACTPLCSSAATDTPGNPLNDPPRPSGAPSLQDGTPGAGGWRLTATRITPAQRSAVINGNRVREGEEIHGARVLHIRHAQVQLATPGGVTTLHLLPAEVKKIR